MGKSKVNQKTIDNIISMYNSGTSAMEIADELGIGERTVFNYLKKARQQGKAKYDKDRTSDITTSSSAKIIEIMKKKKQATFRELSDMLNIGISQVEAQVKILQDSGYSFDITRDGVDVIPIEHGGRYSIKLNKLHAREYTFGVVSDNHLYSKYSREEVLQTAYDDFAKRGIKDVYNCGNIIDGESRFNRFDLVGQAGMDNQVDYLIEHYPQRKDITTYFITGECHEGWYAQRENINIGEYIQLRAEGKVMTNKEFTQEFIDMTTGKQQKRIVKTPRFDLKFLGHMEADVLIGKKNNDRNAIMKLIHPGGGSAYATSYQPQKIVESFQGGEKPRILLIGHYHKHGYFYPRNVHTVLVPSTIDQTPFMRKKRLASDVGYLICTITLDDNDAVSGFKHELVPFFDRNYYEDKKWIYKW